MIKVLFVCMGNICRSPTAHGVFRHLVNERGLSSKFVIESAGTHAYHVGETPDPRSQKMALSKGVDISDLKAQKIESHDFLEFDYVVAMDDDNMNSMKKIIPENATAKVFRLLSLDESLSDYDVPDPYYGGRKGFEHVYNLVDCGCQILLDKIVSESAKK